MRITCDANEMLDSYLTDTSNRLFAEHLQYLYSRPKVFCFTSVRPHLGEMHSLTTVNIMRFLSIKTLTINILVGFQLSRYSCFLIFIGLISRQSQYSETRHHAYMTCLHLICIPKTDLPTTPKAISAISYRIKSRTERFNVAWSPSVTHYLKWTVMMDSSCLRQGKKYSQQREAVCRLSAWPSKALVLALYCTFGLSLPRWKLIFSISFI